MAVPECSLGDLSSSALESNYLPRAAKCHAREGGHPHSNLRKRKHHSLVQTVRRIRLLRTRTNYDLRPLGQTFAAALTLSWHNRWQKNIIYRHEWRFFFAFDNFCHSTKNIFEKKQLMNATPNDSIVNMRNFTQGRLGMCNVIYKAMLVLVVTYSQLFAGDLMNLVLFGRNTSGYRSAERQIEENTRSIHYDMEDLEDEVDESADKIVDAVKKSKLPKNKASIFFNSVLESFNERYPVELQGYAHAMVVTAKRYKMNLIKLNRVLVEDAMMEGGIAYTEAETDAILYKNLDELGFYLKQGKYFLDGESVNMGSFSKKAQITPIYSRSGSIDVRPKVKIKKLDSARVQVVAKINLPDSLESWIELCKLGEEDCFRSKKQFQDSVITDTLSYEVPGMYYVGVQVNGFLSKNDVCDKMAGPYMENHGGWGRHIHYNSKTIKLK